MGGATGPPPVNWGAKFARPYRDEAPPTRGDGQGDILRFLAGGVGWTFAGTEVPLSRHAESDQDGSTTLRVTTRGDGDAGVISLLPPGDKVDGRGGRGVAIRPSPFRLPPWSPSPSP